MKNRSFILFLAIATAVAGCAKEPQPAALSFAARAENIGEDWRTKTVLAEDYPGQKTLISWVNGDELRINQYVYTASSASGGTARFTKTTTGDPSPVFKACYPASAASWSGSKMSITLPATQTQPRPESGLVSGFPMYAESSTDNLSFRNLCGLLKIRLKAASGSFTVTSIGLKSDNLSLSGQCDIVSDGAGVWKASPTAGSGTPAGVQYSCGATVSDAAVSNFYIYLPPGDCTGFDITINTDAGIVHKVANKTISIQRSKVTTISFLSLDPHYAGHDYVDFELPSGTKWATMNVGATLVSDSGTNAAWSDAQDVRWGSAWRVPTKAEFVELMTYTYWQWTDSYRDSGIAGYVVFKADAGDAKDEEDTGDRNKITGDDIPSRNYSLDDDAHIFMPGTSDDHLQGSYWTSSEDAENTQQAYRLQFSKTMRTFGFREINSGEKTNTLFVRPVCD